MIPDDVILTFSSNLAHRYVDRPYLLPRPRYDRQAELLQNFDIFTSAAKTFSCLRGNAKPWFKMCLLLLSILHLAEEWHRVSSTVFCQCWVGSHLFHLCCVDDWTLLY